MSSKQAWSGQPVVVGAGLAGVLTALHLSPRPCVLVSRGRLGEGASSALAQGGVAACMGQDDSPALHIADTLAAGAGLCDPDAVTRIVAAGPEAIETLLRLGVPFDTDSTGHLQLGREAAHSVRRIVHAAGDGTGRLIMETLIRRLRETSSITVLEDVAVTDLLVDEGAIAGVRLVARDDVIDFPSRKVVIASGGIGGLFEHTTNPPGCFGHGLALAARAGAVLSDLEFIQFHPTALDFPRRPMALISEAVRGEGAILVNDRGHRFLADEPGAELATRDVVSRAVWREIDQGRRVFLDARAALGSRFQARFPGISALCAEAGLDPARDLLPVRPAAHYHMGGIAVDHAGRSSVDGLWACGETASTGLHGANRLASNSLLEAMVCARWVAEDMAATPDAPEKHRAGPTRVGAPLPDPAAIRPIMEEALSVVRDSPRLERAIRALLPRVHGPGAERDPALAALMVAVCAWQRNESRGGHFRLDHPHPAAVAERTRIGLRQAISLAEGL